MSFSTPELRQRYNHSAGQWGPERQLRKPAPMPAVMVTRSPQLDDGGDEYERENNSGHAERKDMAHMVTGHPLPGVVSVERLVIASHSHIRLLAPDPAPIRPAALTEITYAVAPLDCLSRSTVLVSAECLLCLAVWPNEESFRQLTIPIWCVFETL